MSGIELVWPEWKTVRLLGEGSFGKVYAVERNQFGILERSAVKIIAIPSSMTEVQSLHNDGMTERDIESYYRGLVDEFAQEIALMSKLRGHSNIVGYEDYAVVERKDHFGWDIYIRMELLTSLPAYMESRNGNDPEVTVAVNASALEPFGVKDVVAMAVDMCSALEVCYDRYIVHRDIKPDNIFVSADGIYKLGDFGVAKTVEKTVSGLSKKGTYTYMAPEIYKGEPGGMNSDIYSLGIVMYKLLNDNREPFLPPITQAVSFADKQQALVRRMNGEALPPPKNGTAALKAIVQKACAGDAAQRYQTPTELKNALLSLGKRNEPKTVAIPPVKLAPITIPSVSKSPPVPPPVPSRTTEGSATYDALIDRGYMALEDGEFDAANGFFERALDQHAKSARAYFGKYLAAMRAESFEALAKKRLSVLPEADEQVLAIEADEAYVKRVAERKAIPGYLKENTILRRYQAIDRSYVSKAASCKDIYNAERAFWENSRFIKRALEFAVSDEATAYMNAKQRVFYLLEATVHDAEVAEQAEIARVKAQYAAQLREIDEWTQQSYADAVERRDRDYNTAAAMFRTASTDADLTATLKIANSLGDYRDAKDIAKQCRDKQAAMEHKQRKKKKTNIIIAWIVIIAVIAAAIGIPWLNMNVWLPAKQYKEAEALLAQGQTAKAAIAFGKLDDYKDAKARSCALWDEITVQDTISAGGYHTIAIKNDNTPVAMGNNNQGQCGVGDWWKCLAVDAGYDYSVVLKENRTVIVVGDDEAFTALKDWGDDFVAVSSGVHHMVALKVDGTVVADGDNDSDQCNVSDWADIAAVSAGNYHTVGLRADGTVVATGNNTEGQCNVSEWTDIIAVSAGANHTVGLKADGTVVSTGNNSDGQSDVSDWTDIISVSAGNHHTVGLRADGTVVATGNNGHGQCDVHDWTDIVSVSAGMWHTVALKADGTVVATGSNSYQQCDVSDWTDIKQP